ncbi:MAG: acyl transferase [Bacteroidetes bacterium]|nr:MAG: acyl transferase [Bacteroidota bacterium]REK05328.1 MAG: acyl transferase [Bacteroidota bacterium]REK36397.1 MAG: acyl transferase [Bacteroidota bacterium]REK51126.1 MAG: acyl transferase [Bacteroidota bacterium]
MDTLKRDYLKKEIFRLDTKEKFESCALDIFQYQYKNNPVYRDYSNLLSRNPKSVDAVEMIPFLPVEFFKSHDVLTGDSTVKTVFRSSGTEGQERSRHMVCDTNLYTESFTRGFEKFYGSASDYCVLALLPSYSERNDSSLVFMVNELIKQSPSEHSGFYSHDPDGLRLVLQKLSSENAKTILIGVSFALLDFVDSSALNFPELIVMETGGMKGRREEIVREELHTRLMKGFGCGSIHSEYGMTEMFSQAYSRQKGHFYCPGWMKVLIRDVNDAFTYLPAGKSGGINIMDLANIDSCSFLETRDLGRVQEDGSFEVLGRFDFSDIRGCNLLAGEG